MITLESQYVHELTNHLLLTSAMFSARALAQQVAFYSLTQRPKLANLELGPQSQWMKKDAFFLITSAQKWKVYFPLFCFTCNKQSNGHSWSPGKWTSWLSFCFPAIALQHGEEGQSCWSGSHLCHENLGWNKFQFLKMLTVAGKVADDVLWKGRAPIPCSLLIWVTCSQAVTGYQSEERAIFPCTSHRDHGRNHGPHGLTIKWAQNKKRRYSVACKTNT